MDEREELRRELELLRDDPDVSERLFQFLQRLVDFVDDPREAITRPDGKRPTPSPWSNKEVLDALEEGKKPRGG